MAIEKIPLSDYPHQRFRVQLDGIDFVFELNWNGRQSTWRFDLRDTDNDLIFGNAELIPGIPLLRWLRDDRLWPGQLILVDNQAEPPFIQTKDPCIDDLAERYSLLYIEAL